jgi:hypothetical protein
MTQAQAAKGVLGAFLVSEEGDIGFAQGGPDYQTITAFRVVSGPCAIAVFEDGTEDMFTSELHPTVLVAMQGKTEIFVAHLDREGNALTEYAVPLSVSLT